MKNDNLSVDGHLKKTIDNQKSVLNLTFDKNFDTQEKTLSLIVEGLEYSIENKHEKLSVIYNISGFVNLISYDLKIISRDLTFSKKEWQKKLYARQAYLIIYESMDDILELCGNNLKNEIKTFRDSEILTSHRKIVIAELNKFKEKHKTKNS